ncbi:MAG: hypothetical protein U0166_28425 [Acidobacteriota bacterium]
MRHPFLAALAALFYATHAAWHIAHHQPSDLLWMCHVASLVIAAGLAIPSATANAIGILWLCLGIPLWILDLATGGAPVPTSFLTHFGGAAVGIAGVRHLGLPRASWWKAVLALCALCLLTRVTTSRDANVNLTFAVWQGWEATFPSYRVYFALMLVLSAATFLAGELGIRRLLAP